MSLPADGIVGAVEEIAGGVGHLVSQHLLLARVELTRDAHAYGVEIGRITLFVSVAAVVALRRRIASETDWRWWVGRWPVPFLVGAFFLGIVPGTQLHSD